MIRVLTEVSLPPEILCLVFTKLGRVGNIHGIKRTCRAFRDAAERAVQAHRRVCFEEPAAWRGVAAAADGRILTASEKTVKVWRDGACERTIQAHTGTILAVAVLPGSARFVSVSYDITVKLWTLDGALERTFDARAAECVAALPDGVHFVVGSRRNAIRLYHVDGTLVHTFKGHTSQVDAVTVTADGQHLISGSFDKTVKVWSVATKSLVSTCEGHGDGVCVVAAMPDGQRILSGGEYDGTVRVWLLNGTLENTFKLHTSFVSALVALPDNQHALSASGDSTVKLFNVNDGAVLRTFRHHTACVNCLALLPDGLRFVSGSLHTVRITEHGLALALTPAYLRGKGKALRARLEEEGRRHQEAREEEDRRHAEAREEEDRRHAEEVRQLRAAIERHDQNA